MSSLSSCSGCWGIGITVHTPLPMAVTIIGSCCLVKLYIASRMPRSDLRKTRARISTVLLLRACWMKESNLPCIKRVVYSHLPHLEAYPALSSFLSCSGLVQYLLFIPACLCQAMTGQCAISAMHFTYSHVWYCYDKQEGSSILPLGPD